MNLTSRQCWCLLPPTIQHAIEAFELSAVDYLLKPFDDERLLRTIKRIEKQLGQGEQQADSQYLQQLAVRSVGKVQMVSVDDVMWIASAGNYVELHLQDKVILHRVSLSYLEKHLNPRDFVRVHRTAMVRFSKISELQSQTDSGYVALLDNGDKVTVSQRYKDGLWQRMQQGCA